jgi:predicted nuclease with TOPRIM domain
MDNEVAACIHHLEERFKELKEYLEKHYASKAELLKFREDVAVQFGQVQVRIAQVHTEIAQVHVNIAKLETTLIKWFIATAIAIAGGSFGIARYFH